MFETKLLAPEDKLLLLLFLLLFIMNKYNIADEGFVVLRPKVVCLWRIEVFVRIIIWSVCWSQQVLQLVARETPVFVIGASLRCWASSLSRLGFYIDCLKRPCYVISSSTVVPARS